MAQSSEILDFVPETGSIYINDLKQNLAAAGRYDLIRQIYRAKRAGLIVYVNGSEDPGAIIPHVARPQQTGAV